MIQFDTQFDYVRGNVNKARHLGTRSALVDLLSKLAVKKFSGNSSGIAANNKKHFIISGS